MTTTAERPPSRAGVPHGSVAAPRPRRFSPRVPAWWRDAVGASTWTSVLVVVALWVAGGGLQDLGGYASALTGLGRLTGLVASDLLLVQVLLMARIPMVERVYGQDELARRHRLVGFTSFNLHARPRRAHHPRLRRPDRRNPLAEFVGRHCELLRHAPRGRRHRAARAGHRHEHPQGPRHAALRVLAPAAPVRLPRRRPRPAAPALDRAGVPHLPRRDPLLVEPVDRRRRRDPHLAGGRPGVPDPARTACG